MTNPPGLVTQDYPNDSDGDALRRLAADGNDMASPMVIEFPVVVSTEILAERFARIARERGFTANLWKHEDGADWDVVCSIGMVPTYADVVRTQQQLNDLSEPFGGYSDGWGTFGNKPDEQPSD